MRPQPRNILAHERQFRTGLFGEIFMLNADVLLAVALYTLLHPISAPLALLGLLWRCANALVQAIGVIASLVALDNLTDAHYLIAFSPAQMQSLARQLLNLHGTAMQIGLIFFGLGASIHACLLWQSRYIPRPLAAAYIAVTTIIALSCTASILFANLDPIIYPWLVAPDFFVELGVGLWLLLKGAKIPPPPLQGARRAAV